MSIRPLALILTISSAALVPFAATATSLYHFVGGEIGYTFNPDHAKSTKARADVIKELVAARKDGSLSLQQGEAYLPLPQKTVGAGGTDRTRAEVRREAIATNKAGLISRGEW